MTTVTCPRCLGFENAFIRFAHVNEGRCLLCDGALVVERSKAVGWVTETGATVELRAAKNATVGGAKVRIERLSDGTFEMVTVGETGEIRTSFEVRNGRVCEVLAMQGHTARFAKTNHHGRGAAKIRELLQSALRA